MSTIWSGSQAGTNWYESRIAVLNAATGGNPEAAWPVLAANWRAQEGDIVGQGTDVAWVHLLAGNPTASVAALGVVIRGRKETPRATRELLEASVAVRPALAVRAARAALGTSGITARALALMAIAQGALRGLVEVVISARRWPRLR